MDKQEKSTFLDGLKDEAGGVELAVEQTKLLTEIRDLLQQLVSK